MSKFSTIINRLTFTVSSINDVAKLEFDFVPKSDTIKFRYVFGSQEYFGGKYSYNDVFGFFYQAQELLVRTALQPFIQMAQ